MPCRARVPTLVSTYELLVTTHEAPRGKGSMPLEFRSHVGTKSGLRLRSFQNVRAIHVSVCRF